jgi:DNA-binding response OmpR family regulator
VDEGAALQSVLAERQRELARRAGMALWRRRVRRARSSREHDARRKQGKEDDALRDPAIVGTTAARVCDVQKPLSRRAYGAGVSAKPLAMLVVEDDSAVRNMLIDSFKREGHHVLGLADGAAALDYAATDHFDVVILDVALGEGLDGYDVCRTLRARRNVVPVIMLTALDSEADAVLGLEAGADDYVTKPFGLAELRSRIRAVLRRSGGHVYEDDVFTAGRVTLDRDRREVRVDGTPVELTFSEFELLSTLMTNPGRVHTRLELLRAIWGDSAYRDPRGIDVHIRHLREKLEEVPEHPTLIVTVRGAGYRLQGR